MTSKKHSLTRAGGAISFDSPKMQESVAASGYALRRKTMSKYHAACSCGQLSLSANAEPMRVSLCHCRACQRRTGSAFGYQARFAREAISINGNSTQYVRTGDSGGTVTFSFCPHCGATVFFEIGSVPEIISVPVGTFAMQTCMTPELSIFTKHKHAWVKLPDATENIE